MKEKGKKEEKQEGKGPQNPLPTEKDGKKEKTKEPEEKHCGLCPGGRCFP